MQGPRRLTNYAVALYQEALVALASFRESTIIGDIVRKSTRSGRKFPPPDHGPKLPDSL